MEDHGVAQYQDILQDIVTLYQDPSIQKCLEQKAKFYVSPILLSLPTSPSPQLPDSAPYFLKKAATIGESNYLPSDEDVLRARSQTTGVNSMDFMVS